MKSNFLGDLERIAHGDPKPVVQEAKKDVEDTSELLWWKDHEKKLREAEKRFKSKEGKPKVLIIAGSNRNENTSPGEKPKSTRLAERAVKKAEKAGADVSFIDLSLGTYQKEKVIQPCKGCYSTSAGLCHYGCTCYPNEKTGHAPDWMHDEIYELLLESHGILIFCPVNWWAPPGILMNMLDRMVCLDGANPKPELTLTDDKTSVKDAAKARKLELGADKGWEFTANKNMMGTLFSIFVHGDAAGVERVEATIRDMLEWIGCKRSDSWYQYIGYREAYAENQKHLDKDQMAWDNAERLAEQLVGDVKKARKEGMPGPHFPPDDQQK